jgi:hypothetical protein
MTHRRDFGTSSPRISSRMPRAVLRLSLPKAGLSVSPWPRRSGTMTLQRSESGKARLIQFWDASKQITAGPSLASTMCWPIPVVLTE